MSDYEVAVDRAIEETDAILATFGALLRIAQIEAGTRSAGHSQAVDLSELGGRIHEAYGAVAEDQGRRFDARIDPGVSVRGDPELLAQMLSNLVENALTHSPAGTPISLAIRVCGQSALMTLADRGPGIPEVERARVLERFVRLDRSRSIARQRIGPQPRRRGGGAAWDHPAPGRQSTRTARRACHAAAGPRCLRG